MTNRVLVASPVTPSITSNERRVQGSWAGFGRKSHSSWEGRGFHTGRETTDAVTQPPCSRCFIPSLLLHWWRRVDCRCSEGSNSSLESMVLPMTIVIRWRVSARRERSAPEVRRSATKIGSMICRRALNTICLRRRSLAGIPNWSGWMSKRLDAVWVKGKIIEV